MRYALIQGEKASRKKVKGAFQSVQENVTGNYMDGNATERLVNGHAGIVLECHKNDAEVLILHQCFGILAVRPAGFLVQLSEFSGEDHIRGTSKLSLGRGAACGHFQIRSRPSS